ncbi:MAG TPA: TonB-dependent receptor [Aridibacter sp.]|nr:TonB-dependent receptor [Aridibacter sp.]
MKKILRSVYLALGMIVLSAGSAYGQVTGNLSGKVTDTTGAVIQGATVTVRNVSTGLSRVVVTDEDGRWVANLLPTGRYEVQLEAEGFKKGSVSGVEVEAAITRNIDSSLEIGTSEVFVDVSTDFPLVQAESATTSRQITGEQLIKTPTSVRSFTALLGSEAGVSSELSPVGVNGTGNVSPSVNGTRTTSTSLFFNGVDATNITSNEGSLTDSISPAPETLEEVKLQTSLYDASTGRSGGGNFQLVTKTGGNDFTGSAYFYLQNKKFNSNEFFLEENGNEKPKADRLETGFTLGGPIVKDRFFFFGGYQYTDANTGLVPTARTRTVLPMALTVLGDDRSAAAIAAAFNQFNGCVGANCLTAADISPIAVNIFNLRNPVTGNFVLPTISNFRDLGIVDQSGTGNYQFGLYPNVASRTLQRNNPLVEVIDVVPSEFTQHQFTFRFDGQVSEKNTLSGTFFYSDFPALDSYPDPSSLASPFTLRRADRNRTLSIGDTHVFSSRFINELRFGYFYLNNSRRLDDPFLTEEFTNDAVGIFNPASTFDSSIGTRRLGHFVGRNNLSNFSFGGPNDSFNRRKQVTYSIGDNAIWSRGNHNVKFGGEYKRHQYDTDLPEEQATEFEKFDSFTQLLTGNSTEADTQYGITAKEFRFNDFGFYVNDTWRISDKLTANLGLRYEIFMWPTEKNGLIGNFDLDPYLPCFTQSAGSTALCDNPTTGFIVPNNVRATGNAVVDGAIAASTVVNNKHTLNGQDLNNFAPRVGLAYAVSDRMVIRGGYGLFYDRPSAAFINTIFSNYPFLREVEITVPSGNVPLSNAWFGVPTNIPLNEWLPFRIVRSGGVNGSYTIRDNAPVFVDARGVPQGAGCDPMTGINCIRGNRAETFEFRAIDRNLETPFVHQWNVGLQYELARDLMFEARYVGTAGRHLLLSRALNQGFDLNDPNTPDHIFERFNQAYLDAGSPNGPLNPGSTARDRGVGVAFGFLNPVLNAVDLNLSSANGTVINFEARVPILGFNVPEALLLESTGFSDYHGGQFSLTRRFSRGLGVNVAYTFSKSIDIMSSDPGSTAGGGKPDVPNIGFIAQGSATDILNNKGLSDFDRTHRFTANFVWEIPTGGSKNAFVTGWSISSLFQAQSGTPFTVFASEPEIGNASQYTSVTRGAGGLYRPGFGRPNVVCTAEQAVGSVSTSNLQVIDSSCFASALGGFGNLGRNTFRGPMQNRLDISFAKRTNITERVSFDIGFDIFNLFDTVNFANPNSDLQDSGDFGSVTNTIGGPRVGQFRAKLNF